MNKRIFQWIPLLVFAALLLLNSCERDNPSISLEKDSISGYVQKGPYLIGTSINLSELNGDLSQTGKVFTSAISNNLGAFEFNNISLSSSFVEIKASGFYFNEIRGENSSAQLSLSVVSDIRDKSGINVNPLTHLEKDRLLQLVSEGMDFHSAKRQAQQEILDIFLIEKDSMAESELLDITQSGEDNAILLAISVILQGYLEVADMSELVGKLNADLKTDGVLDDPSIGTALVNNANLVDLSQVRENLENRYSELGLEVSIPDFEQHVLNFIDSSEYEFDRFPQYPEYSNYGQNVMFLERDTFLLGPQLSLAADLPTGTSLTVKLKGGLWWYTLMPGGPVNWDVSKYDYSSESQVFTASSPGESSDLKIKFDLESSSIKGFTLEYYENGAAEPTRTREIYVRDPYSPGTGYFNFPEQGKYGENLLAMPQDTLLLESGIKYSLAVDFPQYDEAGIEFSLIAEIGNFSVDLNEVDFWTVDLDTTYLTISAEGKDIHPDMSIVFNGSGEATLSRPNMFWRFSW